MEAKTTPASFINAKPCRNDPGGYGCPCSTGTCLCTPTSSYDPTGQERGAGRNLCGCWPEPPAPPRKRPRFCKCGAPLTVRESVHGLQCGACTRRDEALAGVGY